MKRLFYLAVVTAFVLTLMGSTIVAQDGHWLGDRVLLSKIRVVVDE